VRGRNATLGLAIALLGAGVFAGGLVAGGLFDDEGAPSQARPAANGPRPVSLPGRLPEREAPEPVGIPGQTLTGDLAARRGERRRRAARRRTAERRRKREVPPDSPARPAAP
jgi:hypothetical protein